MSDDFIATYITQAKLWITEFNTIPEKMRKILNEEYGWKDGIVPLEVPSKDIDPELQEAHYRLAAGVHRMFTIEVGVKKNGHIVPIRIVTKNDKDISETPSESI